MTRIAPSFPPSPPHHTLRQRLRAALAGMHAAFIARRQPVPGPLAGPGTRGVTCLVSGLAAMLLATGGAQAARPQPLPALNIDITQTSVSGISSGGFMAVQFQIAHSDIVKGAGVVAGGPYYCAQNDVFKATTTCSCTGEPSLSCKVTPESTEVSALVAATQRFFTAGDISDPAHVARQRVATVVGDRDALVPPDITAQLHAYYQALGLPPDNLRAIEVDDAGHTMPTEAFGIDCAETATPYIGKCRLDAAHDILSHIYGPLTPRQDGAAAGRFIQFDQQPFVPWYDKFSYLWSAGMDSSGWVYVPDNCARGEPCRVHIALHGCRQGQSYLPLKPPPGGGLYYGTTFVKHAGYDRWADANNLVILYPQAVSIPLRNPNGCWDWWGFTDRHYADRQGVQIRALRAMVDALAGGRR